MNHTLANNTNPLSIENAHSSVTSEDLKILSSKYKTDGIWKIFRYHESYTLMFYTREQAKQNKSSALYDEISTSLRQLIKSYDTSNSINEDDVNIQIDSKEVFENQYESNLYYYYK